MKIIMIFDQIQAGLGSKDDAMVPLTGKKEPVGPAVMMEPFLKEVDGHVAVSYTHLVSIRSSLWWA